MPITIDKKIVKPATEEKEYGTIFISEIRIYTRENEPEGKTVATCRYFPANIDKDWKYTEIDLTNPQTLYVQDSFSLAQKRLSFAKAIVAIQAAVKDLYENPEWI